MTTLHKADYTLRGCLQVFAKAPPRRGPVGPEWPALFGVLYDRPGPRPG
jgi:hypothetical protein